MGEQSTYPHTACFTSTMGMSHFKCTLFVTNSDLAIDLQIFVTEHILYEIFGPWTTLVTNFSTRVLWWCDYDSGLKHNKMVKLSLCLPWTPKVGADVELHSLLPLAVDGVERSIFCAIPLSLWERAHSAHWIGGCVYHRASQDVLKKRRISCLSQESNPGSPRP